ncbi:MAG: hypothetical protein ABW023_11235 [Sphingomonas sp.]
MTSTRFTRRWLGALGALLIFKLAFPLITPTLVLSTGCRGIGGACGAMALVLGLFIPMPVIIGAGAVLVHAAARRGYAIGMPASAPVFVLLMYLGAAPMLLVGGSFWAVGIAVGVLSVPPLWTLAFLLAALVGLSCYPGPASTQQANQARTVLGILALVISILTAPFWLQGLAILPVVGRFMFPILSLSTYLPRPLALLGLGKLTLWVLLILFVAGGVAAVLAARRGRSTMADAGA